MYLISASPEEPLTLQLDGSAGAGGGHSEMGLETRLEPRLCQ